MCKRWKDWTEILLKQKSCSCEIFYSCFPFCWSNFHVLIQTIGIEPGMDSNDTLKLPRAGGADPDSGQPGDLFVTIKVSWWTITLNHVTSTEPAKWGSTEWSQQHWFLLSFDVPSILVWINRSLEGPNWCSTGITIVFSFVLSYCWADKRWEPT